MSSRPQLFLYRCTCQTQLDVTHLSDTLLDALFTPPRHPLTPLFVVATLACRFVLPALLWSSAISALWKSRVTHLGPK